MMVKEIMSVLASTTIDTDLGPFKVCYHDNEHYQCVSFSLGDVHKGVPVIRIHSACLFGEVFHSDECDCGKQLTQALGAIKRNSCGVIVYSYQEGRGAGLLNKIKAMNIQKMTKCNTSDAFDKLGLECDIRDYSAEIQALQDLDINNEIIAFEGNKQKIAALEKAGYAITKLLKFDDSDLSEAAKKEVRTRADALKHIY